MLFQRVIIRLTQVSQHQSEITCLCKLISSVDRAHNLRHGIWNVPVCLVILLVYSSIYLNAHVCETKNKMHIGITNERKWQQPQRQVFC